MNASLRFLIASAVACLALTPFRAAADEAPVEDVIVPVPDVAPQPPAAPEPSTPQEQDEIAAPPEKEKPPMPPSSKTDRADKVFDSVSHEEEWDVSLQAFLPDSTFWSSALGVTVEHIKWKWDRWGWGLLFAVSDWSAAGGVLDLPFSTFSDFTLEGSETAFQLGLQGAYRRPMGSKVSLVVKAGLSYLSTRSDLRLSTAYTDYYGRDVNYSILSENVNQLLGRVDLALRRNVTWGKKDMYVQAGVGYQVLLAGDEPGFLQEDIRMSMDALSLRLGLGWRW